MDMKITGLGLYCSMGQNLDEVFARMCKAEHAFSSIGHRFTGHVYPQMNAGIISQDNEADLEGKFDLDDLTRAMMKMAASEAIKQAGHKQSSEKMGLLLATNFGPMASLEWAWWEQRDLGVITEETYTPYDEIIQYIGEAFDCNGPRMQISMSCASGAAAVSIAADVIRQGRADKMLIIAYDYLAESTWCGLTNLRTITTDIMRPFDSKRSGTIFSEGAAAMLLEREGASDSPALAWLLGSATNNNAHHMTAPPKEAAGSRRVMETALELAGLKPQDIEHICAHATSTKANDETEAAALRNIFGDRLPTLTVTAHKSQLGHLLGVAGLAEAAVTIKAMIEGKIPPTINHDDMDPDCIPVDCNPGTQVRNKSFATAITNSAGIGGNNSSLVISAKPQHKAPKFQMLDKVYVQSMAWVVPDNVGKGKELLDHPEWFKCTDATNMALQDFSAKNYLKSVKGYLDLSGGLFLTAASLCLGEDIGTELKEKKGICTGTRFGANSSGYQFFTQMNEKGPRLASPLIFPHSYANTPGNLVSIEFGYGGPHAVYFGNQDIRELLEFAAERLADGTSDEMLLGVYEAANPVAIDDGRKVLNGAIALKLTATPSDDQVMAIDLAAMRNNGPVMPSLGAVEALGQFLIKAKI
ncbi:MAG: hypothetical protein GX561_02515 [Lentisphaerae bacterium]|jgi:3-oxoacyl-(acyl-carrier-protein) synthase|nr:hypothetical protein [Lentisphaerota bacterium]